VKKIQLWTSSFIAQFLYYQAHCMPFNSQQVSFTGTGSATGVASMSHEPVAANEKN
jgi:hypothetical protein